MIASKSISSDHLRKDMQASHTHFSNAFHTDKQGLPEFTYMKKNQKLPKHTHVMFSFQSKMHTAAKDRRHVSTTKSREIQVQALIHPQITLHLECALPRSV